MTSSFGIIMHSETIEVYTLTRHSVGVDKVTGQGRTQDICKGGSIKHKAGGLGGAAPQMLKGI